ncbi:MAG: glycosyltransferase, exosortase A system-associated [Alphaproteobacteria bacterium]|nr:glycosyltransferase, exosortase A system-associated [Alphaproteobacteria bacterium]
MRILHVLDHSLPFHSGYVFRTLSILEHQRRLGWETVQVTTPRHRNATEAVERVDGWVFHRTPEPSGWLSRVPVVREMTEVLASARRIRAVAREVRPDVIHAHSPVLNAIPAWLVARLVGVPFVYEIRAFWEDAAVDHGSTVEGSARYRATRMIESFMIRRADAVMTICEGLRADIVGRGVDPRKITVIPNAVNVGDFTVGRAADRDLKRSLGLEGKQVLGFIGSFYAYEGLDVLLEAVERLKARRDDVAVLLVGGGPQDAALRAQAEKLGLHDLVRFTGRVPHAEVQRYYDLVDVLCYPRKPMRLTDLVTPLKPLEAMAQGRIVLASDVGGHRELIRDRDTGYLFAAGDPEALATAIDDVLNARDAWDGMRVRARRFVEDERSWERSVAGYSPVYTALCRGRGAVQAA